jgi:hypothetical protein
MDVDILHFDLFHRVSKKTQEENLFFEDKII